MKLKASVRVSDEHERRRKGLGNEVARRDVRKQMTKVKVGKAALLDSYRERRAETLQHAYEQREQST